VVAMGKLRLSGFVAWLFWSLVHILFLIGFRSKIVVAFEWLWSFVTRQRSARLISDGAPGHTIGPSDDERGLRKSRTDKAEANV
jgi:NADH dehydrogenase